MTTPLISIERKQSHLYEWFITAGIRLHRSEFDQPDLAACLQTAAAMAPSEDGLIEIIYRQIHMGTHRLDVILKDTERVARQLIEKYAHLTDKRVVVLS